MSRKSSSPTESTDDEDLIVGHGLPDNLPHLDRDVLQLAALLGRITGLWESRLDQMLRPLGLQSADLRVLGTLLAAGPKAELTVSALQGFVALSSGGTTKAVDRLHKLSLITKRRDDHDNRVVQLSLTKAGRRRAAQASEALVDHLLEVTGDLSKAQLKSSIVAIDHILRSIQRG